MDAVMANLQDSTIQKPLTKKEFNTIIVLKVYQTLMRPVVTYGGGNMNSNIN
jgi:hypothetical protein